MPKRGFTAYNDALITRVPQLNLLAIDTSSSSTLLGLVCDGELHDRSSAPVTTHSREILPAIDALFSDAGTEPSELDAIVFGQGPGSFTGLRIAVGVVQGLGYGLSIPVVPVSSMACMAQSVADSHPGGSVMVALYARLEEIYYGAYRINERGIAESLIAEAVQDIRDLPVLPEGRWMGLGDGFRFADVISSTTGVSFSRVNENASLDVADLLELGKDSLSRGGAVNALEAAPVYLREEVASKPATG